MIYITNFSIGSTEKKKGVSINSDFHSYCHVITICKCNLKLTEKYIHILGDIYIYIYHNVYYPGCKFLYAFKL